jgi:hypothetical protein
LRRGARVVAALLAIAPLAACSAIIGTRDLTFEPDDAGPGGPASDGAASPDATTPVPGTDGSLPDAGPDTSPSGDANAGDGDAADAFPCIDTKTDPHNCGRCGHDCVGGDCDAGVCQPVTIVSNQPGAIEVAVDQTSVYWTGNYNDQILSSAKDGANVTILAHDPAGNVSNPYGLAIDDTYVYWSCNNDNDTDPGRVARCAKTGCNGAGTRVTTTDLHLPREIAVDGTNVYFEEYSNASVGRGRKDGGPVGFYATTIAYPLTVDFDDASVYFASTSLIGRVAKGAATVADSGTDASKYTTLYSSIAQFYPYDLATDDANLYWIENDDPNGLVRFLPKNAAPDAAPIDIATAQSNPWHVVVDATNVYWTGTGPDSGNGTYTIYVDGFVATCPKTGCGAHPPTVLATGLHNPRGLAIDDTAVYVAISGNADQNGVITEGGILKVAKP